MADSFPLLQVLHLVQDILFLVLQIKHVRHSFQEAVPKPGEHIWWQYGRIILNNAWSQISALIFCAHKLWSGDRLGHDINATVLLAVRGCAFIFTVTR